MIDTVAGQHRVDLGSLRMMSSRSLSVAVAPRGSASPSPRRNFLDSDALVSEHIAERDRSRAMPALVRITGGAVTGLELTFEVGGPPIIRFLGVAGDPRVTGGPVHAVAATPRRDREPITLDARHTLETPGHGIGRQPANGAIAGGRSAVAF